MKYKDYIIEVSEHEPGKWKATISRVDGRALTCEGAKLDRFTTSTDTVGAAAAVRLACGAIDEGHLS
jgi:hypothetical protein